MRIDVYFSGTLLSSYKEVDYLAGSVDLVCLVVATTHDSLIVWDGTTNGSTKFDDYFSNSAVTTSTSNSSTTAVARSCSYDLFLAQFIALRSALLHNSTKAEKENEETKTSK